MQLSKRRLISIASLPHWLIAAFAVCLIAALLWWAFRPDAEQERLKATTQLTYDTKTGKLARFTSDLNKNGKVDTWTFMDGTKILHSERDRNEDGAVDYWEYNLPDGKGGLEHTEEDSNGDGRPNKWDFYRNGLLYQVEWDDNFDGVRDRRWTYSPKAELLAIETEPDGRGGYVKKMAVGR